MFLSHGRLFPVKIQKSSFSPMHHRNADRTVKYKIWFSWKSIPQHSTSQAFLDTSPSQTYSTPHPASSHLSTSYKAALKLVGHAAAEGVMDICCMGADAEGTVWLDVEGRATSGDGAEPQDCKDARKSSQRDHRELSSDSSPQIKMKDHMSFQPTGVWFVA